MVIVAPGLRRAVKEERKQRLMKMQPGQPGILLQLESAKDHGSSHSPIHQCRRSYDEEDDDRGCATDGNHSRHGDDLEHVPDFWHVGAVDLRQQLSIQHLVLKLDCRSASGALVPRCLSLTASLVMWSLRSGWSEPAPSELNCM